ncbi:MAG: hypothetical protein ILO36_00880 [Abditibacteriota bacterium]|nr:hypothetical protein [Abditibacteriota bacterium]
MTDTDKNNGGAPGTPSGIDMLRKKWLEFEAYKDSAEAGGLKDIVFSDGAMAVGDYSLEKEEVMARLNVGEDALRRLTMIGELDSIVAENIEGQQRRLYSASSVERFMEEAEIPRQVTEEKILEAADKELLHQIFLLQDMVITQSKYIKYLKDMLLLEIRNIKEQNLDLASYVYELAEKNEKKER